MKTCLTLKKKSPAKPFLRLEKLFEERVSKSFKERNSLGKLFLRLHPGRCIPSEDSQPFKIKFEQ